MKNTKQISIFIILALIILVAIGFIGWQNTKIDKFENGFDVKGTYGYYNADLDDYEYIVFPEKNQFEHYISDTSSNKGTLKELDTNVFLVEFQDSKGYIFINSDDTLEYIDSNFDSFKYEKKGDVPTYVNRATS